MKSNHFLFHYLLKKFQSAELKNLHLLIAVSGGVDSMTLLSVLLEIRKILNLCISVVHVHHGAKDMPITFENSGVTLSGMEKGELKSGATWEKRQRSYEKIIPKGYKAQKLFQDQAAETVEKFCVEHNIFLFQSYLEEMDNDIPIVFENSGVKAKGVYMSALKKGSPFRGKEKTSKTFKQDQHKGLAPQGKRPDRGEKIILDGYKAELQKRKKQTLTLEGVNEAAMRQYRYKIFFNCIQKSKADYLVLAHTANDLLETRLIRLIRGTGEQGLRAMSFKDDRLMRPFIHINRTQIMDYAKKRNLKWCEDPSNKSVDYSFRNWIRHKWLPQLEKKRPGSIATLSRSLNLMALIANTNQKKVKEVYQKMIKGQNLRRDLISILPLEDAKKILAYYIKKQGFKNYHAQHILELIKQINRSKKNFTFFLLGKKWKMSAQWLQYGEKE